MLKRSFKLRFGLKAIAIAILIVCLPIAWLVNSRGKGVRELEIISNLERPGQQIRPMYEFQLDQWEHFDGTRVSSEPRWLQGIMGGCVFERLHKVVISDCKLQSLDNLEELAQLEELYVDGANCLTELQNIGHISGLRVLSLSECDEIRDFSVIGRLPRLESLCFHKCQHLEDIDWIAGLKQLNLIRFTKCDAMSDLSPLAKLSVVNQLQLYRCNGIKTLEGLQDFHNLESLQINESEQITDISALFNLRKLQYIDISGCDAIPRKQIEKLQEVFPAAQIVR